MSVLTLALLPRHTPTQTLAKHTTRDWVLGMAYGDVDNDGRDKLVLGLRDGHVEVLDVDLQAVHAKP